MINSLVLVELERTSLYLIGTLWIRGKEEIQVLHSMKMVDRREQNHGFIDKAEINENDYSFSIVRFRESLSAVDKNTQFWGFHKNCATAALKGKIARRMSSVKYNSNSIRR